MKYTVTKMYSYSFDRKRYIIHPGDIVILVREHIPEERPFGDKSRYKEFRDSEGREFIVYSGDYSKFIEKK